MEKDWELKASRDTHAELQLVTRESFVPANHLRYFRPSWAKSSWSLWGAMIYRSINDYIWCLVFSSDENPCRIYRLILTQGGLGWSHNPHLRRNRVWLNIARESLNHNRISVDTTYLRLLYSHSLRKLKRWAEFILLHPLLSYWKRILMEKSIFVGTSIIIRLVRVFY